MIFYVYMYLDTRKENSDYEYEPFYVGKGKGPRDLVHLKNLDKDKTNLHKSNRIKAIIRETGDIPKIVRIATNLSENDAYDIERRLISELGRADLGTGCLLNLTDGGDGSRNLSSAGRNTISEKMKGDLNPNSGGKLWEKIPHPRRGKIGTFAGKHHSEDTIAKISAARARDSDDTKKRRAETFKKVWEEKKQQWCKRYEFISPYGEITVVDNGMQDFLRKNGLNQPIISQMIRDPLYNPSRGACVGWSVRRLD